MSTPLEDDVDLSKFDADDAPGVTDLTKVRTHLVDDDVLHVYDPEPDDDEDEPVEPVPADPPDLPKAPAHTVAVERRPIVPAWVRDPAERRDRARFYTAHTAHAAAFHTLRIPKYGVKLAVYAPRGAGKATVALLRWARDTESANLRRVAATRPDPADYLKLAKLRDDHAHTRLQALAVGAALLLAGYAVLAVFTPPWAHYGALAAGVVALGLYGARGDKPLLDRPMTSDRPRKLTVHVVERAFERAGLSKPDDQIGFPAPIARDRGGWLAVIDLPYGKKATDAIAKRDAIASGLDLDEQMVFLSRQRSTTALSGVARVPTSARRVNLWVADTDPYASVSPASPLATRERANFWDPFPFGVDAKGQLVTLTLVWSSLLVGAIPRMGKTFSARIPAAAAALDPHVRLHIWDGKGGRDWQVFRRVAHRYGSGIRGEVVEALVADLRALVDDMDRRYEAIKKLTDDESPNGTITPALCRAKHLDMPLVLVCIDEVQRYLQHAEHGKTILALLVELAKVGPAAGIMLVLATQRPSSDVIPADLRDNVGTRFALKVMTWQSSDTVLGAGSYPEHDASKLLRGHKGVGILLGADDSPLADVGGQTVRTHLLDAAALRGIVDRGHKLRIAAGTLAGEAAGEWTIEADTGRRNLLDDIAAVFGADARLWSETICERLAEHWPAVYDGWSAKDLGNALRPFGLKTHQFNTRPTNRRGLTRDEVLDALAARIGERQLNGNA